MVNSPDLSQIKSAEASLKGRIVDTPLLELCSNKIMDLLPNTKVVKMKMELFQHTGSFKARGVLIALDRLSKEEKSRGVVAFSAGNHALAVSWGAKEAGVNAKVVMLERSDPSRIQGCTDLGADVILASDIAAAQTKMKEISVVEKRTILQPFESKNMILGSATCGLEIIEKFPELDAAIIPIGGGGLIAGIATAIKAIKPSVVVYGVEPIGADSMYRSFQTLKPEKLDFVDTIADSLGPPMAMEYSFGVAHNSVDAIVRIKDQDLVSAMTLMRDRLNLMVEPACSASLAGLLGPLKDMVSQKSVALIACGSNISPARYQALL